MHSSSSVEKQDQSSLIFLRNNPSPMWIFDHQTLRFLEVNDAAIVKYGYSRSEFLNMKITDIRPKDQVPKLLAGIRPFELHGDRITDRQHLTKDRRLLDVQIIASQLFYQGRPAVLVEVDDITERKHAEESSCKVAVVEERNRIAREIHDTFAQSITGIILQLEGARTSLRDHPHKALQNVNRARSLAKKMLNNVRQSVWQLRIDSTCAGGLSVSLKTMTDHLRCMGVPVRCVVKGIPRPLPTRMERHLLRITQEALTNAIKYSKATKVDLNLIFHRKTISVSLQDNGIGFSTNAIGKGFGLIFIQERADRIGAELKIFSSPGKGSKIMIKVSS